MRPENTLEAFRHAIDLGCRHVETDVHLSRDGHIVVIHDDRLERTTDGIGPVAARELTALRRLDAGHNFAPMQGFPWRGRGLRIPTLAEVFELHPDLRVNVEIKGRQPALIAKLWALIEDRCLHDRALVACEDPLPLRRFRRRSRGRVLTSASFPEIARFWAAARVGMARWVGTPYCALQVPMRWRHLPVITRALIDAAHARGVEVHAWTIDDEVTMRHLVGLGIDGIMSDRPATLLGVLAELDADEDRDER